MGVSPSSRRNMNQVDFRRSNYKPHHPFYDNYFIRLQTYTNWRPEFNRTPTELSEAGFFYTGYDDLISVSHMPSQPSSTDEQQRNTARGSSHSTRIQARLQVSLCKKCLLKKSTVTFLPCGHLITCDECANNIKFCLLCERRVIRCIVT
ncbi:hypothetical protein KUTeg_006771 [Tegillarca granosa]|uniref:RING-type domain-containing protein n=1 Tax=Tegillarca granosa TaxID=220873 RepID=A0ABQ9FEH3_TEGGR|nr:hypothetical protein KUTeg_006771 [Tegillarca granosa]